MLRVPASLKVTVPLIVLAFAAMLAAVSQLHFVPQAEEAAQDESRKRFVQEMSRLQSTLEYLLLKGDHTVAAHEIEVLAHNHDVVFACLVDERGEVIATTRRSWLGRRISDASRQFNVNDAADAVRERRARVSLDAPNKALLGYAGILMPGAREELRPSRVGTLYVAYDLDRAAKDARAQVFQQSVYWAGWVAALALAMWLAFHFLLTRRTAQLMRAAEQLAAGDLHARSGLKGGDELGRLGRAFDDMARVVAEKETRLREDIAERKRAEEALQVSEASYRAIFDAAEDAIFVHDMDTGGIIDVNPKACAAFGYSREEFRALSIGMLGSGEPPHTQQHAMRLLGRVVAGEQLRIEWHGRHRNGDLYWFEVFGKRVKIGGVDRILALARDITDRKHAEAALRASEEQYRAMFNASIDGLALWNASGEIVDTNPALWRMYGYGDGEITNLPPGTWEGPCYRLDFLKRVAAGEPQHTEVNEVRRDGTMLQLEVHGIPMHYQGEPHVLTIARDITDKKRADEELARQREALYQREKLAALGSLLAGVAHELNNPLSVVVARAVLLEEQGDPATQSAALRIRTAAERCARIVRTFLAMARQQQPERGPVAINDVIAAALDIGGYAIRTSSIDVKLALAPGIPLINADADQLHQVLLNLIINAQQSLQELPPPRRLEIASWYDAREDLLTVRVADNGPGIPAELRARVFEPFFTTKPTGVGTGVGLAVSLGVIEAHGGTLAVDCPDTGGAVFTIKLKVGMLRPDDVSRETPTRATPGQRSILIVDDEPEIRSTLAEILAGAHHRVVAVSSGREALKRLQVETFDVILTDIRMPDIDGRALYQEILVRWPGLAARVVFITGDTLASTLREFVSESGQPVIEKPFLPADVRRVVAELVGGDD
jgi:PAS domain S-box-containing protein